MNYLGLDIGGSSIKWAVMDSNADILFRGKEPVKRDSINSLVNSVRQIKDKIECGYEGVAVSMPGRIDTSKGIAHTGGAFTFIQDTDMRKVLNEVFHKPVTIANDGKCAAYAEAWKGSLADVDNGAAIVFGTGIGGGIILNHSVWMGSTFAAGELSMFPTDFKSSWKPLQFGNNQEWPIWAAWCSTTTIIKYYAERKKINPTSIEGIDVFKAYDENDPIAIEVLNEFAKNTAVGIYGIQSILDLQKYAIGGGISAQKIVTELIRSKVDELWELRPCAWFSINKPIITTCTFQNDSNLIGALRFHIDGINQNKNV